MQRFPNAPIDANSRKSAASATPASDFETRIENDGVVVVKFLNRGATSVVVPEKIDGRPVVKIGKSAFAVCLLLTAVALPNDVQTIGKSAFEGCLSLRLVALPNGVQTIGDGAFASCDLLTSIDIPASVQTIGKSAFKYCRSLTSVEIPNGVEIIGDYAFTACNALRSVAIPASVREIGDEAFADCASDLTLYGAAGSVAEKYARENGLRFKRR